MEGISEQVFEAALGYFLAPIGELMQDEAVREVMINGHDQVFIEKGGQLQLSDFRFDDEEQLMAAVRNIAQYVGVQLREEVSRFEQPERVT